MAFDETTPNDDGAALLARLQAQFGDMNVGSMINGENGGDDDADDSESSLEEPTPEELRTWQQMQYEQGRMKMEAKKLLERDGKKSALQYRRQNKSAQQRILMRESENEDEEEWEYVDAVPDLGGASSVFFPIAVENDTMLAGGVNPLLAKLVKGDVEVLGTKWTRLYSSSDCDGLSFSNLCHKICGYAGPTVMLLGGIPSPSKSLGAKNNTVSGDNRVSVGFFTTDSWTESTEYFGESDDCFLFSLENAKNDVKFIRPKSRGKNSTKPHRYMYCNPTAPSNRGGAQKKTNGLVHGIGIGGSASQPRMHITESLEECRVLAYDNLFDDGDLLPDECGYSLYYFDVDCIEVWGVGGDEWISDALESQAKAKQSQAATLEQARKVDKKQFLDHFNHFQNGLTSGNNAGIFDHQDFIEGRCDL